MALSNQQKKKLKAHAHSLKPVVRLGQSGLTSNVLDEIESAITHHELIKVKVSADDRDDKKAIIQEIADKTASELIQSIGFMAVFYRENQDKKAYS
ncbi:MAG: ribosome assembly RNA-binding protein YhbY [Cycloclasticus pugetii]|jgi:RNA-binding protein|uniref:RNA-binding protein n=2 Tax=Cycloclasticus TaxID=34067 RepID=S5T729_9GAMM|nr:MULTISPECIES: ribosome assembly RNA-binding protein YhbY [Cycloclasticus]AFT67489.1 23S rRNA methyltransferase J [Cycloclasticus sp. P1]AGS39344.1 RNA-binding protein [Cycloclasticus zancles 78-ME]ATI02949.1 ribosome assembly RNA-binding protein YhbY [Cycloclasticus sp. PY97N]EPD13702.1 23S rRNA methyltransferase J [Cycloclasticus pugetii]PHR48506.1 MAG: ribosome assembly RNA-binding protein YhbY [Cycloclasticus sp.]|tara:strand:+ start:3330 stop:3617 length:288 start_codon:yes stop_codon:yes gene_type:complete